MATDVRPRPDGRDRRRTAQGRDPGRPVLALFIAMLDNVVVSNALPTIDRDLGAGVSGLQWSWRRTAWCSRRSCSPAARSATATGAAGCSSSA
ncbi:hypothetical protein ACU686_45080 [Yinghuangia aomiensis]